MSNKSNMNDASDNQMTSSPASKTELKSEEGKAQIEQNRQEAIAGEVNAQQVSAQELTAQTSSAPQNDSSPRGILTPYLLPLLERLSVQNVGKVERILTAAGGLGVTYFAFKRKKKLSALSLGLLGAGLLARAFTGRCPLYASLNVSTNQPSKPKIVPIQLERSVTIDKPRSEVFQFFRELPQLPLEIDPSISINRDGQRVFLWIANLEGEPRQLDLEITNERDGELIAWHALNSERIERGLLSFRHSSVGGGTILTLAVRRREEWVNSQESSNDRDESLITSCLRLCKNFIERGSTGLESVDSPVPTGTLIASQPSSSQSSSSQTGINQAPESNGQDQTLIRPNQLHS